ncbi:MAG: DsbE family thiol:disulfide interchange protein [Rhodospirillaceae bacterium]|nr:DsbE family thiol:disulfide interchange protein [Rhodospirillaceae bacterium]
MRQAIYLLPLVLFLLLAGTIGWFMTKNEIEDRDTQALPSVLIDQPAPQFDLPPLAGIAPGLARADLGGRPALVNFFASWCLPCRAEHPILMALAEEGAVAIYGVNYKDPEADARDWLEALGNRYERIGIDATGRTAIEWGVYGVPETFVIDAKGRVRYRHVGPVLERDMERTIRPLLAEIGG